MNTKILGNHGEDLAAEYLKGQGYTILERQYRISRAEIDIIAEKAGVLVFIEVKTRRGTAFGSPAMAVTREKQQKIIMAAKNYLRQPDLPMRCRLCRFDVIEVLPDKNGAWQIRQIENAFET